MGHCWKSKGSQLQVQIYVNCLQEDLESKIVAKIPSLQSKHPTVTWKSPLEKDGCKEYRDGEFLAVIGQHGLANALNDFWPLRGPRWDALASLQLRDDEQGVLLIEGKGHLGEMRSKTRAGCSNPKTGAPASEKSLANRQQILQVIQKVRNELGVETGDATIWIDRFYQMANRLAYLCWLREHGVQAWLVNLLFLDDESHKPTDNDAWLKGLKNVYDSMGLTGADLSYVANVLLPARNDMKP